MHRRAYRLYFWTLYTYRNTLEIILMASAPLGKLYRQKSVYLSSFNSEWISPSSYHPFEFCSAPYDLKLPWTTLERFSVVYKPYVPTEKK